jgi:hypothetical protein
MQRLKSGEIMDAPSYPPATAFVQPMVMPTPVSLRTAPLGTLVKMPAAWAIVLKHLPALKMMVGSEMIQPHLGNMTVVDVGQFAGVSSADTYAAIDAELRTLPAADQVMP